MRATASRSVKRANGGLRTAAGVIAFGTALALTGCSTGPDKPELKVDGAFMPQPVSDTAAGFLTVHNSGSAGDKLTAVTSTLSDDVTIHESKNRKMRQVKSFGIPAEGELNLERGGNHLMFMQLKERPKKGQKVAVELHFEKSDPIKVELPVKEPTYNPAKH
ncbi:copper chaperone PCu(A)C [Streptomyces albipurpureus]|uniref:Copper chaperone PCu(A)C n=1 Tax=Streptomyces albipurpureus TaxID=2897419 RepID=A0ABT0US40_9ACTN|nr:copper chaperone PCu(A)C [Streptomyces sp. CWNU-1]MCM2391422.1 copper chaperone PCu(A)C [Streptomyces sp. CWNU-1]